MPRLCQAVLAVGDLNQRVELLRAELGLGEPFADPAIEYFGIHNAVFAIGDTFLELVSPIREGTDVGRLLDRRGGDCGYMAMIQVDHVAAARERARALGIREVFEIEFEDIAEIHLHPHDIGGAIVSVSEPRPAGSWKWGGPNWSDRSVPGAVLGIEVAVADAPATKDRWLEVAGGPIPGEFTDDPVQAGIVRIELEVDGRRETIDPSVF